MNVIPHRLRLFINGKKAGLESLRQAVNQLRTEGISLEVRVTWEGGDLLRLVQEAAGEGVQRVIAAGGDGTLNEMINGLMALDPAQRPELGIIPLGTANDFARACTIPDTPLEALRLAVFGRAVPIDVGQANDRFFINVASGGFGAQVSAETPAPLKNLLGGGAYALSAMVQSLNYMHSEGRLTGEEFDLEGTAIVGAVCNGRQAGGGQVLAPNALLDDGLLDILVILTFPITAVGQVIQELFDPSLTGEFVKRYQSPWVESWPKEPRPVNLDGEPYLAGHIRFQVCAGAVECVLPPGCPCLSHPLGG